MSNDPISHTVEYFKQNLGGEPGYDKFADIQLMFHETPKPTNPAQVIVISGGYSGRISSYELAIKLAGAWEGDGGLVVIGPHCELLAKSVVTEEVAEEIVKNLRDMLKINEDGSLEYEAMGGMFSIDSYMNLNIPSKKNPKKLLPTRGERRSHLDRAGFDHARNRY